MGLDIYLFPADAAAKRKLYDEASEALYEEGPDGKTPRDLMTDDEYKAWSAEHQWTSHEDVPSVAHPDHLFNRRYLRSSYNAGGFNHAVPDLIGTSADAEYPHAKGSLYWIFQPMGREWDGDEGLLDATDVEKLRECRSRAVEIGEALRGSDRLRVTTVSPNMFRPPPQVTDDQALEMYRKVVAEGRVRADDGWWSNIDMECYGGGFTVLAAIPGKDTFTPGIHLIYRAQDDGFDSYVQSVEIVVEFCDEAIALIERDGSCEMSWSG